MKSMKQFGLRAFILVFFFIFSHQTYSQSSFGKDSLAIDSATQAKLDSLTDQLNEFTVSLNKIPLRPKEYYHKVDSFFAVTRANLNGCRVFSFDSADSRSNELLRAYRDRLRVRHNYADSVAKMIQINPSLDSLPEMFTSNANNNPFIMGHINTPEFNEPDIPAMGTIKSAIPSLNSPVDLPSVDISKEFAATTETVADARELKDKAGSYAEGVKHVDVKSETHKLPGEFEKQAEKLDGVANLKEELPQQDGMLTNAPNVNDLDSKVSTGDLAKEIARRKSKLIEVDHLEGKSETIQAGLLKMEKLQRKYNSLADIRYLPKKRPNSMKGKPFLERVTPGFVVQVRALADQWKAVDLAVGAEYFFNDHFRAGLQGSYRVNTMLKPFRMRDNDRVYGFRAVANYKIIKGFYGHVETSAFRMPEYLKRPDPQPVDSRPRTWDLGVNVGVFKTYTINKTTRGTFLALYDLSKLDETLNFGQVAVRFGLEFKIVMKKKIAAEKEMQN